MRRAFVLRSISCNFTFVEALVAPAKLGRLGELRVFQQTVTERLVLAARVVAEGTRQEPHHRLDDAKRRELTAGEHEVPEGDLVIDREIERSLIDALVATAEEREAR